MMSTWLKVMMKSRKKSLRKRNNRLRISKKRLQSPRKEMKVNVTILTKMKKEVMMFP